MDHSWIINKVITALFTPEERRLSSVIAELNNKNKELKSSKVDGFLHSGKYYLPSTGQLTVPSPGQAKPSLHFSLQDEMETWMRDMKSIKDDRALVNQMLFRLLQSCRTELEIRDALPECVVSLAGLSHHPRCHDAAYTLRGDHRAMRQYAKLMEKIQLYSVMGMLY